LGWITSILLFPAAPMRAVIRLGKILRRQAEQELHHPAPVGGVQAGDVATPEITQEMIAERAYHISESGEGGTDDENWLRAEAELRQGS
jgi:DUF2934 family protein